jgi:small subunit ribosomal protein S9
MSEDKTQGQEPEEQQEPTAEAPPEEQPAAEEAPAPAEETPAPAAEETPAPAAEETPAPAAEETPAPAEETPAEQPAAAAEEDLEEDAEEDEAPTPRVKPLIPGADLEVDIVREGEEALRGENLYGEYDEDATAESDREEDLSQPIADASIDLAAGARYTATGKRKTAVARVILKPGDGTYAINGKPLDDFFPRPTLQRTIRQPLETVGYETRMDVVAAMHGGGVSAQADALRHGISRALIEADPNLRSELKRRGFLTRDARVKERKKAGLKKARKRPQFSKR